MMNDNVANMWPDVTKMENVVVKCYWITNTKIEIKIQYTFFIIRFFCPGITIYPAMTAFTDQYSLPNIFFDIGQL